MELTIKDSDVLYTVEVNYWQIRSVVRLLCDSRATCFYVQRDSMQNPQLVLYLMCITDISYVFKKLTIKDPIL